jgi:feruloyl esterase
VSCSDGGREGLMEAQRFPDDYNGILAGDPANNWTHLMTNGAADLEALQASPASYISQNKLPALSAAVLAACNAGQAAQYLNDPNTCHFNPETLLCSGAETDQCLTQPEINALKDLYAGATLSTGVKVFPGLAPGGELGTGGWNTWITGSSLGNSVMTSYVGNFFANMVYQNPKWTYTNFNVDQGLKDAVAAVGTSVDANVADLTTFNTAGGKLILYQGWNDPAVSPFATIQYYNRVVTAMGTKPAANSVRLFMVPGMHHCDNGPGPTNFGQSGPGPNTAAYDANHSVYKALETWVEQGVAPNKVITTGQVMEGGNTAVTISRPLCAYPLVAKYNGSGDQTNAANFHCANE